MSGLHWLGAAASLLIFAYLLVALFKPEVFE
jgi:K+-transporting ATPase KdpF subunit